MDGEVGADGSLFEDFQPPINPPAEIDDPSESKPEDWVDAARYSIPCPTPCCLTVMDQLPPAHGAVHKCR